MRPPAATFSVRRRAARAALLIATLLLFATPGAATRAQAQEEDAGPRLGADLSSMVAVHLTRGCLSSPGSCELYELKELSVLGVKLEQRLGDGAAARARLELRQLLLRRLDGLEQAEDVAQVAPVSLRLAETRLDLFDLLPRTDLAVGLLRLPWGTADGINPLDRLNPFDLEDPTRFDRRLASPALLIAVHPTARWTFELVALPVFVPAVLPAEDVDLTSAANPDLPFSLAPYMAPGQEPPVVRSVKTRIALPQQTLEEQGSLATRLGWDSPWGTFALSGMVVRDSLPQVSGQVWMTGMQSAHLVDVAVATRYPRLYLAGLSWRGELPGRLTGWVEAAAVRPSRTVVTVSAAQMASLVRLGRLARAPEPGDHVEVQASTPFVQAVAGLDRTFGGRLYLNVQLLRGLPLERTADDVHHYLLLAARWGIIPEKLDLELQGLAALDDPAGQAGMGKASLAWLHADRVRIALGACAIGGEAGTLLGRFDPLSHLRLEVGAGF